MQPGFVQFRGYPNNEVIAKVQRSGRLRRTKKDEPERKDIAIHSDLRPSRYGGQLDFASVLSQKTDVKRGSKGISKKGRLSIRRYAALLGRNTRRRQVFLTGTLPGSTEESLAAIAEKSGYMVKMVQTYLSRAANCDAKQMEYVWVWEHQKRGALHMHLVARTPSRAQAKLLQQRWRSVWSQILRLVDSKVDCDLFEKYYGGSHRDSPEDWQVDAALVKKSAAKYLSKYLSKGGGFHSRFCPSRWWGVSSSLRSSLSEYVNSNTILLPLTITNSTKKKDAEELLRKCLDFASGRFSTSVTPWFQDTIISAFTFKKNYQSIYSFAESVINQIGEGTLESTTQVGNEKLMDLRYEITEAVKIFYAMAPIWLRERIEGMNAGKAINGNYQRYFSTRIGYLDFEASWAYMTRDYRGGRESVPLWFQVCDRRIASVKRFQSVGF